MNAMKSPAATPLVQGEAGTPPVLAAGSHDRRLNIAEALFRAAARFPEKPAVVWPRGPAGWNTLTFAQLVQEVDHCAAGLCDIGVERGTKTILMVRPGGDFFALTFALFKLGAVPVLIDPGIGRRGIVRSLAEIEAEAFIGVPLAHLLRILHPRAFRSVRMNVTVGRRLPWSGHRLCDLKRRAERTPGCAPTRADEPAAILFTSGSTGPSKGAVYTHGIFDAQVRYLESHYGYGPDEVDLATFPLFALFDAALGMTAVIPQMDASRPGAADPRRIVEAIHTHACTHMFGSPALLRNLARHGARTGARLPTIRRVLTAGAPAPAAMIESLRAMLPDGAAVHTPYGATEALPVSDIESREILGETAAAWARGAGTCVGRPMPGLDVRIIAIRDGPIASRADARELRTGEIGEIIVRGPVVTESYYRRPAHTALAKLRDADAGVWHRMGDVGYLDERGRLWFCGRKSQRVATAAGALFTEPCEAIFATHPAVSRAALVGVGEPGRQTPVMCIEPAPAARRADRAALRRELLARASASELTRGIRTILFHPRFPVDVRHNAKIFREKLAAWAARRLGAAHRAGEP